MLKMIQEMLNGHEKKHPELKKLNNISSSDLKGKDGKLHPSRPLAMHTIYSMDGHPHNREIYGENFDHLLIDDEKEILNDEAEDIARTSLIVHDPRYIFAKNHPHEESEGAKDVIKYLLAKHGHEGGKGEIMKEVFEPFLKMLHDKVHDDENAMTLVLSPNMVKRTPHKKEDFTKMLRSTLLFPAFDGKVHQHWEKKLPKIIKGLMKGEYK